MAMNVKFRHKETQEEVILYSYPTNKSDNDKEMCAKTFSMSMYVMNKEQFFKKYEKVE